MASVTSRGAALLEWLASLPPAARDAALEAYLGIDIPAPPSAPPGECLIGYHASGVAPVVRALIEVPVAPGDIVVDLGAGLGKVVLLARLLTGAVARGIEIQPALVKRARAAAARLAVDVGFAHADVREADLDDGTVFFMYAPFVGPVLAEVVDRLHRLAARSGIVVCALGVDLDREAPWLVRRPVNAFWLTIYDSAVPGAASRPQCARPSALGPCADAVAFDRAGSI
jgi:SAM-dependent methyltransferase